MEKDFQGKSINWWNKLQNIEKKRILNEHKVVVLTTQKLIDIFKKMNPKEKLYVGINFYDISDPSFIYSIIDQDDTNIFLRWESENGMIVDKQLELIYRFENYVEQGKWVIVDNDNKRKSVVICLNCKSYHYKGIQECPDCSHKSFQDTYYSNAVFIKDNANCKQPDSCGNSVCKINSQTKETFEQKWKRYHENMTENRLEDMKHDENCDTSKVDYGIQLVSEMLYDYRNQPKQHSTEEVISLLKEFRNGLLNVQQREIDYTDRFIKEQLTK